MVEYQIKNYFDFLFYIGVTSNDTSSKIFQLLSSKYNNISNQEKDINSLLASLTCDYLKSLDKNQLELIGKNIYEQYLINKLKSEAKVIYKLLIVRYNYFKRKKKKYFNKWRFSIINSDDYNYIFFNRNNSLKSIKARSYSKKNIISSKHFLDKLDFYNDKKKENNDKIKLMSESNLTNECTFKPSLKYIYKRSSSKKIIGSNENKVKNKCKNNESYSLKNIFGDLLNYNKNMIYERHPTVRNNYTYKNTKENNINNVNNKEVDNNYFSGRKRQTSGKKRKKAFKT